MRYIERPIGASNTSVKEVEEKFSVTIPTDLYEFWLQSDGPILWFENENKELQFFSILEILGDDIYCLKRYMPGSLPICMDGNGNICVARIDGRDIVGFFVVSCGNLGWDEAVEIANNFWQFLRDPVSPEKRLHA